MSKFFFGQVVLVIGGVVGIGCVIVLVFVVVGVKVVVVDLDSVGGEGMVEVICQVGGEVVFICCDVICDVEVKVLVEGCVVVYGCFDYVFNNVGIEIEQGKLVDGNEVEFDVIMVVNVKGVWLCMKYQILLMLVQGGGVIVNIVLVVGFGVVLKMSIYVVFKYVVIGLIKLVVIEYVKKGICVNVVCLVVIDIDMFCCVYEVDLCKVEFVVVMYLLGWVGWVEEIVVVVFYLCSDNVGFIIGIVLLVDGGVMVI